MMRSRNAILPALAMAVLLTACAQGSQQAPATAPSLGAIEGATNPNPAKSSRVVALTSLSADLIYRLDQRKLVGIPGSRLLRQNAELSKLPQVSEGQTPPNLEKILALKPDLVIGASGFHDPILARLQAMGIRTLTTQVTSWKSLEDLTLTLATEIQADPNPLLQTYRSWLTTTAQAKASALLLVSDQPMLAPNKTSWAGDLLHQFQLANVSADLQGNSPQRGYVTLSPEKVLEANPEVLILVDMGDGTIEKLKSAPFWQKLKAVTENRVYIFDYYGLVNPGSLAAIEKVCQQLQQLIAENS